MSADTKSICPKCGYEYESWVEVCPDCNVPIEVRPTESIATQGQLDPQEDPQWTVAANAPNAIIGNILKSQLQDAGIPVLMQGSYNVFTHTDYAPHDLRVPLHFLEQAHALINSIPGYLDEPDYDTTSSGDEYDEDEPEDRQASWEWRAPSGTGLPESFSMLPTEWDVDTRQQVRRSHGELPHGWHWSDSDDVEASSERKGKGDEHPVLYSPAEDYSGYPDHAPRNAWEKDTYSGYGEDGLNGRSKWIRIIYGIMIAAMSLPFILQLLQQMWSMLGR